jgi:histidinol-phosphate/aromatic aminotransferase/cobyric acid decarboxylase-like protein
MMDLRRNAQPFREACTKENVLVGRPFPPLDTHVRISIGTLPEMKQAVDVFRHVLSAV